MRQQQRLAGLTVALAASMAWAPVSAWAIQTGMVNFDGSAGGKGPASVQSLLEAAKSSPVAPLLGHNDWWYPCDPNQVYHGGPCDPGSHYDPYPRYPYPRDPYPYPRYPYPYPRDPYPYPRDPHRPAPRHPGRYPAQRDWSIEKVKQLSWEVATAARSVYDAAMATRRRDDQDESRAIEDLADFKEAAHHFRDQVTEYPEDPYHTEQDYYQLMNSYEVARSSVRYARLHRDVMDNFHHAQDLIRELQYYYRNR